LEKLTNIIEGILFAAGDPVPVDLIKEKLEITKAEMDKAVRALERKYSGESGILLLNFNHKLQLATNPEYRESIAAVLNPIREKEFTRTILECAAIIAYKQPITRSELEAVRGVNSDYALTTLQSLGMIEPCGRKDTPGKPVLFATTDNFLKRFKLKSLSELPDYEELMKKIAELNTFAEDTGYLYEKDVYDPENDPENFAAAADASTDDSEDGGSDSDGSSGAGGSDFEVPDFLKDIDEDLFKIE